MKRFTIMLPEKTISKIKQANYSPKRKREIIEKILQQFFTTLEINNYPGKEHGRLYVNLEIKYWEPNNDK